MTIDFYFADYCPSCRSVLMAAEELGLELNKKVVNLMEKEQFKPEFLKVS